MKKSNLNIILFLSFTFLLLFVACNNETEAEKEKRLKGNTIIETGEIAAINSRAFTLARYGRYLWEMKVIGILEHGTIVNAGDSIIQLDPVDVKKMIVDWETDLERELAALQTLLVNQENQRSEIDSRIRSEIASFDLKKIELEATRFEAERVQKIKQLEFKQAEINLTKEKRKLEFNSIIEANNLKIQKIRVNRIETQIKDAYDILPNLTIRTPISGVFQIGWNRRNNSLVKVGDDLYPGSNMASVPELKWMRIDTHINETDFLKIRVGQKVIVRLDAMPEIKFDGEVSYIGKLCHLKDEKSRQKVFDVEIKMLKHDERLKPGMTVSCEYIED